jgi:hypothetical protein
MLFVLLSAAPALAVADAPRASLSTVQDGVTVDLPLVETRVKATIHGDVADVQLVQVYANPSALPLDAQYVFPLPTDAAVHRMRMTAGDHVIEAEIPSGTRTWWSRGRWRLRPPPSAPRRGRRTAAAW